MSLIDLVFPPRCVGCDGDGWPLCPRCGDETAVVTPPICARCGRPTEEPLRSCADCPPRLVDAARAPFLYEGPLARGIRRLKFAGWRALAPALAGAMAASFDLEADVVTWVPLSGRRRAHRGFDQAEVLARAVASRLRLPVVRLLTRARDTPAQARRAGRARRGLAGAFTAVGSAPRAALLVDDVLTTGATAAACARALRRAGARRVVVLTAARAVRGPVPARCWGAERHL